MRQGQRLNTLVNQLLDVSRLQQGQFVVNRRPLDVAVLVGQVVDEVRATLPPHSPHTIELTGPDNSVVVDGDRERLEQVLHNLLSNAIKYSPAGGLVTVEGIGIPADAQARLFDPFSVRPTSDHKRAALVWGCTSCAKSLSATAGAWRWTAPKAWVVRSASCCRCRSRTRRGERRDVHPGDLRF